MYQKGSFELSKHCNFTLSLFLPHHDCFMYLYLKRLLAQFNSKPLIGVQIPNCFEEMKIFNLSILGMRVADTYAAAAV